MAEALKSTRRGMGTFREIVVETLQAYDYIRQNGTPDDMGEFQSIVDGSVGVVVKLVHEGRIAIEAGVALAGSYAL